MSVIGPRPGLWNQDRCGQQCLAVHPLRNRPVCNLPEEKSVDRSTGIVSDD